MDVGALSISVDDKSGKKVVNGRYTILKKLGQGQYGKVLLGELKQGGNVAIKTIHRVDKLRLLTRNYNQLAKIRKEIDIMKTTSHPNIVKLLQVIDDLKYDKILLILEYCKYGELDWKHYNHYYQKYYSKSKLSINKILRDVVSGLDYLHFMKIIHRDLKPSNLLIDEFNVVKISDFGVSLILQNNSSDKEELSKSMGTPAFFAPELCQFVRYSMIGKDFDGNDDNEFGEGVDALLNKITPLGTAKSKIDYRIDIWSLGVILYCLIFNELPFNGCNEFDLFKNIVKQDLVFPKVQKSNKTTPDDVKELGLLKDLIQNLLQKNPNDRLTLDEIKNHPFTLFDLSASERLKFLKCNDKYYNQVVLSDTTPQNDGFSNKIKKLFGKSDKVKSENLISAKVNNSNIKDSDNYTPVEIVDDLLDSYLDDSSSFGSDVEEVDTSSLLGELNLDKPLPEINKNKLRPPALNLSNLTISETTGLNTNIPISPLIESKSKQPFASNLDLQDRSMLKSASLNSIHSNSSLPSPYKTFQISTPTRDGVRSASFSGDYKTDTTVTIGATSPSTFKTLFSPSQRFFARNKSQKVEEKKPTITSLRSPLQSKYPIPLKSSKLTDFIEPPPKFALNSFQPPSPSNGLSSRKNSISSGYGLSRISSSSSSLNLHAYLTDDNSSIISGKGSREHRASEHSTGSSIMSEEIEKIEKNEADETNESNDINDSTMVISEEFDVVKNYTSMSQFLDSLDSP